jgi:2'-hydroxyisoflavone reductase
VRVAGGERMIAPGPPERPIQFVDVRDLAAWTLELVEQRRSGAFNATNRGLSMSEFLAECPGDAEVVWASDEFLAEHGVTEEDLPLWTGDAKFAAIHEADVGAALAAGLTFRPVAETARDTLEWDRGRGDHERATGMDSKRESALLEAWEG